MTKELELWNFVGERLRRNESVMLLIVAESSGSSPGRQGYKMAVGADGALVGSIGGGLMEVNLVEESRGGFRGAEIGRRGDGGTTSILEQVHRVNAPNASGMICSGRQTVIFKLLTTSDASAVGSIAHALENRRPATMILSPDQFEIGPPKEGTQNAFERISETDFVFTERLGFKNELYIVGGGHCALALSELMSKMDFHISLFDDRPEINTVAKNRFAHEIVIIDSYDQIDRHIEPGKNSYVVVMTLGYKSDDVVIRRLINHDFKYFGVLGSNAKMTTMLKELVKEGLPRDMLDRIRTPVGVPINSRTPEEIAVSIAAEIISVKNAE